MKIIFTMLLMMNSIDLASASNVKKLDFENAKSLITQIQKCTETTCFESHFSKTTSKLERQRLIPILVELKLNNLSTPEKCTLNFIELGDDDSCFEFKNNDQLRTQYFFKFEKSAWKFKSIRKFEID